MKILPSLTCLTGQSLRHWVTSRKVPSTKFISSLLLLSCASLGFSSAEAARQAEYLDRGVVALPSGSGIYIGWRMLGDDANNISFNVYRNNTKLNSAPITNSTNYFDASGTTSAAYTVRPIINGVEQPANAANATWSDTYKVVNLQRPADGTTPAGEAYSYSPNDVSTGDLDGDGQYELIVKWDPSNSKDNSQSGYTGNVYIDAYRMNGTQMWRIDLGRNIRAGAHYTQFMVYDLDGDGKAEVALKTADGTRDGNGTVIGSSSADYRASNGYVLSGPEFLTVFNGQTGAAMATTDYVPARGTVSSWGDNYGNRVDRFLAGIAYVDGSRPSLIMSRGYYTRAVVVAWDWRNGKLTRRWTFDSTSSGNSAYAGQGAHSLTVGDVDADGKDEIVFGAAVIDDNGSGLYSTKLGHGDALHLGDLDPSRPGLEVFMVHESPSSYGANGVEMHDAKTGQILWNVPGVTGDVGRGVTMDIDPRYPGSESWSTSSGVHSAKGQQITSTRPASVNFGIWWDGDFLREQFNSTMIEKWDYANSKTQRLLTGYQVGAGTNNGTKATPNLLADLFGDWREEVVLRNSNNNQLMIFTTNIETTHKLRTLMHDIQYREAIAWQNVAYNQPPHPSFFLGDGMATPPAPSLNFVGTNPNGTTQASSSSAVASSAPATADVVLGGSASSNQVVLSWSLTGDINAQEIYYDTDTDPAGRVRLDSVSTSDRSYTATGLSSGTSYSFWVKYRTTDNEWHNSNTFTATTLGGASSAPASSTPKSSSPASSAPVSSAPASSTPASSQAGTTTGSQCNWYGTLYPVCATTNSGWGWENSQSCVSRSDCTSQPAPYGVVGGTTSSVTPSSTPASSKPASSVAPSSIAPSSTAPSSTPASSIAASSKPASSIALSSVAASSQAASGGGKCTYVISNNWGSGFTGAIRIANNGTSPINGWNISWKYSGSTRITSSWNAAVSGSNPYSASDIVWNGTIQPGQAVEFGFQGTHSGTAETPTISGAACN